MNNIKLYKNGKLALVVHATQTHDFKQGGGGTRRVKRYPAEVYKHAHRMGFTRRNGRPI